MSEEIKGQALLDPVGILNLIKRVHLTSYIDRCSNIPHIKPYSVSDHSFFMALYGMMFAELENIRILREYAGRPAFGLELQYSVEQVIKKALVHDLEEAITGDVLYPLKHMGHGLSDKLEEVRTECVNESLFKELPENLRKYYIRLWEQAKDTTKEGIMIACMDKFEILIFAINEMSMGNGLFRGIYDSAVRIIDREFNIESVRMVVEEIRKQFG